MRLIGRLGSPYVRRTAIALELYGLPYTNEPLSVFRDYDAFAAIGPVVKAPTLVLDDGTVLIDSSLILAHLERLAPVSRRLVPVDVADHARATRFVGLALAACDKAVQLVYERDLRPAETSYRPWLDRVTGQLRAACREIEAGLGDGWLIGDRPLLADITAAVAWRFAQEKHPGLVAPVAHPRLAALSARAEALPAFAAAPYVD